MLSNAVVDNTRVHDNITAVWSAVDSITRKTSPIIMRKFPHTIYRTPLTLQHQCDNAGVTF